MTMHLFEQIVRERFGGRLAWGAHEADSVACALEAAHAAMGDPWSDRPDRWPDIRPLNDGPWSSDTARAEALVPLLIAYWDWAEWSVARRQRVMDCLVRLTVQQLIAELPGLPATVVAQCRAAATAQLERIPSCKPIPLGVGTSFSRSAESLPTALNAVQIQRLP